MIALFHDQLENIADDSKETTTELNLFSVSRIQQSVKRLPQELQLNRANVIRVLVSKNVEHDVLRLISVPNPQLCVFKEHFSIWGTFPENATRLVCPRETFNGYDQWPVKDIFKKISGRRSVLQVGE